MFPFWVYDPGRFFPGACPYCFSGDVAGGGAGDVVARVRAGDDCKVSGGFCFFMRGGISGGKSFLGPL